jgi:predicted nucleic acid-binding protein
MANFTVVYDANVLYPAPLRDLLMRLALTDMFRARWTDDIHDEWIRNVLEARPDLTREQLERTRELMNANVRDCVVEGYQSLIPGLELPDPDDRHVLAAAILANASVIVTFNLRDFPAAQVEQYGIEAQHPDEFITYLIDLNQAKVCAAAEEQRRSLRQPPKTVEEYLETLLRQGLPQTATLLGSLCYRL